MALTALDLAKDLATHVGLDNDFNSFSGIPEGGDLLLYLNEAYQLLLDRLAKNTDYVLTQSATLTTVAGQQDYSLPSGVSVSDIAPFSFYYTDSEGSTKRCRLMSLRTAYERYEDLFTITSQEEPYVLVIKDYQTLSTYPLPDATYTVHYKYNQTYATLTLETDTFIVPDKWTRFIKKHAQYLYERNKGFSDYDSTFAAAEEVYHAITADIYHSSPGYIY